MITTPILGSIGLALTVPRIALMAKGYGAPSDAKPDRADFIYVGAEQSDPRRGG